MLIAGDSTLPAFFKALEEQNGCGYMHESEGSVITDIWRNSAANYNTALRKAAEHEAISRNRVRGASEIPSPRCSLPARSGNTARWYRVLRTAISRV
jgi:hypothetical protein